MRGRLGLFKLADQGYAVPLDRLLRVVETGRVEALPLIPDEMAGMLILEDEVIPLLDSDWLPGVPAGLGLLAKFRVLLATEFGPVALPAESTVGIVAENRGTWITSEQEFTIFQPECFCYHDSHFQVLNIDVFIMGLIRS